MSFEDIYKAPFSTDKYGLYVKSSNGVKAFTVAADNPKEEADNMVALLNGEGGTKYKKTFVMGEKIVTSNASVFITRGWGNLIGVEKLSPEDACKIQDEFISHVISKIKE